MFDKGPFWISALVGWLIGLVVGVLHVLVLRGLMYLDDLIARVCEALAKIGGGDCK